jgi:hypothetical protein
VIGFVNCFTPRDGEIATARPALLTDPTTPLTWHEADARFMPLVGAVETGPTLQG